MALRTILVLALAALIAAGCGGDDDDDGDAGNATPSAVQTETTPDSTATTPGDRGEGDGGEGGSERNDSGKGADGGGGSLTRAAFIRRADKICADVRPELGAKGQEIAALARRAQAGKLKPDEYFRMSAVLLDESAEAADGAVDQLEELPRPDARRAALERYLAATRDQVDYLYDQAQVTRDGDQQEAARLNALTGRITQRVRKAATEYGFKVCGGGS